MPIHRAAVAFLLVIVWFIGSQPCMAAPPTGYDSDKLESWLNSYRIRDLRAAVEMIRRHPSDSLEHLSVLARRSNHPELKSVFSELVPRAETSRLKSLSFESHTRQAKIIQAELQKRQMVRVPDRTETSSVKTKQNAPSEESMSSPGRTANESSRQGSGQDIDLARQQLAHLSELDTLSDADWDSLLNLLDDDYVPGDVDSAKLLYEIGRLAGNRSVRNWGRVDAKFLDSTTKHPERLIPIVTRRSPRPDAIDERIFQLTKSPDQEVRKVALRHFPASPSRSDEYAAAVLGWLKKDPSRAVELSQPLSRCAIYGSRDTRVTLANWFLEQIESLARAHRFDSPERLASPHCVSGAINVVSKLDRADQEQLLPKLIEKIRLSNHPMQYVRLLQAFDVEISDAGNVLNNLNASCSQWEDQLFYSKYLYMARRNGAQVLPILERALSESAPQSINMRFAVSTIGEMGVDAISLLPQLIKLLNETDSRQMKSTLMKAIGDMGSQAGSAAPSLMEIYRNSDSAYERNLAQTTLRKIGSLE